MLADFVFNLSYKALVILCPVLEIVYSFLRLTFVKMAVWSFPQEMWTVFFMFRQRTEVGVCLSTGKKRKVMFTWHRSSICLNKYKITRALFILPVLSPSPSCPQSFLPQPNTPPDTEVAKLCSPPAAIWTRGIADRDRRCWGELAPSFLLPRPSWPLESWPHVYTWPSVEESPWLR